MIVQTVDGKTFELLDFSQFCFGKDFEKARYLGTTYGLHKRWLEDIYISTDSIIRFWDEDDE